MQLLISLTEKIQGVDEQPLMASRAVAPSFHSHGCKLCYKCCKVLAQDITDWASTRLCDSESLSENLIWLQFVKDHTHCSACATCYTFLPVTTLLCWFWCRRWSWKPSYFDNTTTVIHMLLLINILRLYYRKNTGHLTSKKQRSW